MINEFMINYPLGFNVFTSFCVILFSFLIFRKTYRLYSLSGHKGLRIFSYSFLFFAIAFLFGQTPAYIIDYYIIHDLFSAKFLEIYYLVFSIIFHYYLTLGGFSLVYSLIWREFENYKFFNVFLDKVSFIKNPKEVALYIDSLVVTLIFLYKEMLWFIVIMITLLYATFLSYNNYKKLRLEGKKNTFAQFYFFAMILGFIGFGSNFLLGFFSNIEFYTDMILIFIFAVFLWGTYKIK